MEFQTGASQMEIQFPQTTNEYHGIQLELNLDDPVVAKKVERTQK